MDDKCFQAGVIGLRMGNAHCQGYRAHPRCRLVALCDTDEAILQQRQKEYAPVSVYSDYRQLIQHEGISILSVASPDYFHAEQCIAALRAGIHVLCEKPLTLNLQEAQAIIAEVEKGPAKFMIGQVGRYAPGFVLAKRLIDDGMIGELYLVESEYAHSYAGARGIDSWRVDPRREPFIGGGCHAVDLLRWIAGEALSVSAFSNHKCLPDWPVNDCSVAIFRFANDIIGKVMVSIGCIRPYTMRSAFYGTEGTIICDNTSSQIQVCSKRMMQGKLDFASLPVNIANHNVGAEISDFIRCIENNLPIATNVYEGTRTVAAALAAVESAKLDGQPVSIPIIPGP
jgi:UDP-N-acetylglucosamine 3-dehydrogenase